MDIAQHLFHRQTDLRKLALATELEEETSGKLAVFGAQTSPPDPAAQVGLAFLGQFYGGCRHVLRLSVALGRAGALRIQLHSFVSEMNKLVLEVARDGTLLYCGEEFEAVEVRAQAQTLEITLTFRAITSLVEWIYVLAQDYGPGPEALFSCAPPTLEPLPEPLPMLYRSHYGLRHHQGVDAVCQSFTVFQGSFNLRFEILKPGSNLVGLALKSKLELGYARWWSFELAAISPQEGELTPVAPRFPIRSPGLMDRYGPDFSNMGHTITGVFAQWQDAQRMDGGDCAQLCDLTLQARFECGAVVDLPLSELLKTDHDQAKSNVMFSKYILGAKPSNEGRPKFLEVGARGPDSQIVRAQVSPHWDYIGLDYQGDSNVDIIADAHQLSQILPHASVDVVYSSEVIEHLMSPLRFVLEANRVLRAGGLFLASMPTTWPLHAEPWDFWRITRHGWTSLLNKNTGFEILERLDLGAASVVAHRLPFGSPAYLMPCAPAPLLTAVVARKIAEVPPDTSGWSPDLAWGDYDHA